MSISMTKRFLSALGAVLLVGACDNAGAYRTTGITATGVAQGLVFFDANGSGGFDAADSPVVGARVRLITPLSSDTVVRAATGADGTFRVEGVPVGSYSVIVDPTSLGDSATVMRLTAGPLTVRPNESVNIEAVVSFPSLTVEQVRTATLGTRVFVTGVALHARGTYSDTLLHIVDTSGALRATRVRPTAAVAGDSVRLRGRVATRDGQRVLDDVTVYVVGATFIPTAPTINTLTASTADAGTLDGSLVRLLDAVVTDTATVAGSLTMTVDDGSGALTVLLDRVADIGFRAPFTFGPQDAGTRYDLIGVLVPSGSGSWVLRPRAVLDLTPR
jgi:hypothetical protein